MPVTTAPSTRKGIRQTLQHLRRQQTAFNIQHKSTAICQRIVRTQAFQRSQHLALYYPQQGEVDLRPLIRQAWQRGKQVYFPVLHPLKVGFLIFRKIRPDARLFPNKYGIPEALKPRFDIHNIRHLDFVLMPLVAFDIQGNRIGMGGGYYDRTFCAHKSRRQWRRPRLMGVAFEFQKVPAIPFAAWDVILPSIVTEVGLYVPH